MTTWRLKNILLKKEWVNEEIKKEIKKYLETNDNENNYKIYGMQKRQYLEGSS